MTTVSENIDKIRSIESLIHTGAVDNIECRSLQEKADNLKKIVIEEELKGKIAYCNSLGYYIYLKDGTKAGNRKLIKAATKDKLEFKIYSYLHGSAGLTLRQLYPKWKLYRESIFTSPNSKNTIARNDYTWKKYYTGEVLGRHKERITSSLKIIDIPIRELTPQKLFVWAQKLIVEIKAKEQNEYFDRKKFERIFNSIIGLMLRYASDDLSTDAAGNPFRVITENPWVPVLRKLNELSRSARHSFITDSATSDKLPKDIIFSKLEIESIFRWIDTHAMQSESGLAIEFAFVTGLRPSEIVGLRVSDLAIESSLMYIRNAADNIGDKYLKTSNSRRIVPLCEDAIKILAKADQFSMEHGYLGDYAFRSNNSANGYRLSYYGIRDKLRKVTSKLNIPYKSPSSCRKTLNSMLVSGADIPEKERIRIFGHTSAVNDKYYTFFTDQPKDLAKKIDQTIHIVNSTKNDVESIKNGNTSSNIQPYSNESVTA